MLYTDYARMLLEMCYTVLLGRVVIKYLLAIIFPLRAFDSENNDDIFICGGW